MDDFRKTFGRGRRQKGGLPNYADSAEHHSLHLLRGCGVLMGCALCRRPRTNVYCFQTWDSWDCWEQIVSFCRLNLLFGKLLASTLVSLGPLARSGGHLGLFLESKVCFLMFSCGCQGPISKAFRVPWAKGQFCHSCWQVFVSAVFCLNLDV